jgi:pyruvate dehydrogenase E1 component alpha subunit
MDVVAVEEATRRAVDTVRCSGEPVFVEYQTYRFRAHSMYDPDLYRTKAEIASWRERDPIDLLLARLRAEGLIDDAELERLEKEVATEIAAAIDFAEQGSLEPVEELTRFVHSDPVGVDPS